MQIKFFGTGAALQVNNDNTYFLIDDGKNKLQVDCGGGLGLAQKIIAGNLIFKDLFITHSNSDHLLGFFHLLRILGKDIKQLNIYCSKKIEDNINIISGITLGDGAKRRLDKINFIYNDDLKEKIIGNFKLKPLNLYSKKMEQFGFLLDNKGKKILFFGDEAINILERDDLDRLSGIDYLICEALIPEYESIFGGGVADLEKFQHISARQAGKIATKLKAKNLILIHTREFLNREGELKKDAEVSFNGNIMVPKDGEIINII